MPVELTYDQQQMKALKAKLKVAGEGGMTRDLNRSLRVAAQPVAEAERQAARGLPAGGDKSSGLRANLAAAVTVSTTATGVSVKIPGSKMPGTQQRLPKLTSSAGWRHPVFGHDPFVSQTLDPGWFPRTALRFKEAITVSVRKVMDDTAKKIAH